MFRRWHTTRLARRWQRAAPLPVVFGIGVAFALASGAAAADWPTFRADNQRTGSTEESLPQPLAPAWQFQPSQPPTPAWPPPARSSIWQGLQRIQPRVEEDRAPQPVVAQGRVFIASSSEDHLTCLDAATGNVLWRHFANGPIRYAPSVATGRVYFGSDDGYIECLRASDGAPLWRQAVAPEQRVIPGNGRLISAWPARTGVIVRSNTVYTLAGLFPSQGVYAAAFQADNGAPIYRTAIAESPEGYILAGAEELYVPTGRGSPVALELASGKFLRQYTGINGTFALITENQLIGRTHDAGTLDLIPKNQKSRLAHFPGRQMVVHGDISYLLADRELVALDRARLSRLTATSKQIELEMGRLQKTNATFPPGSPQARQGTEAIRALSLKLESVQTDLTQSERWRVTSEGWFSMIRAGDQLVVGGSNRVALFNCSRGSMTWEAPIPGRALGLAVSDQRLIVTTDRGSVHAFAHTAASNPPSTPITKAPPAIASAAPASLTADFQRIIDAVRNEPETRQGYALVHGASLADFARSLAQSTALQVTVLETNKDSTLALRQQWLQAGLYGPRLNVLEFTGTTLPFTDGFANVVVSSKPTAVLESELRRCLRPFGGRLWLDESAPPHVAPPTTPTGNWTHLYANTANTASTADPAIHTDLALQWFGGPGPQTMTDRHLRATAPLVCDGRMVIVGEDQLIGLDAFNGTTWWQRTLPGLTRYSIPYDCGYVALDAKSVYAAVGDRLWQLDAPTGDVRQQIQPPASPNSPPRHWGYVGIHERWIFGSTQHTNAARREATYKAVDDAYLNRQPLVTSDQFFCLQSTDHRVAWTRAEGPILNTSITITDDAVVLLENRSPSLRSRAGERLKLQELTASDLFLVNLEPATGRVRWEKRLDLKVCENILYVAASKDLLVISGSGINEFKDAQYHVWVLNRADGSERWHAQHGNNKPGELGHGEQVHHPVVLENLLVAEPVFYDLNTGKPFNPEGKEGHWPIVRPGHSCGTMSGAGQSLFFRANNPTALSLEASFSGASRFTRLAPSRPGCWINIIPANGLVLIPEASAGCVCNYSLQTSMAFRPRPRTKTP